MIGTTVLTPLLRFGEGGSGVGKAIPNGGEIFNDYTGNTATGFYSHAEGWITTASGSQAHSEGSSTQATGDYSHAEGNNTQANGLSSHAEGDSTIASGDYSHAEGERNKATGQSSHAEGAGTTASERASHSEGVETVASNIGSHAEGRGTKANGEVSHAEGSYTTADNNQSHAEGDRTLASGQSSHAEGSNSIASGNHTHSEGNNTQATGDNSHAEGDNTKATGFATHTEGCYTQAIGNHSHAEGSYTTAEGTESHAEGSYTKSLGKYSHSEGGCEGLNTDGTYQMIAKGDYSHIEGTLTNADGTAGHAEGINTKANGTACHAEGINCIAENTTTHAEGANNSVYWVYSHVEGTSNILGSTSCTNGNTSHVEGMSNNLSSINAIATHVEGAGNSIQCDNSYGNHIEGSGNILKNGQMIHLEGYSNIGTTIFSHVQGTYNIEDTENEYADIIGWGTNENNRSNIFTVSTTGNVSALGSFNSNGADYAELWEWEDGNVDNEDRRGLFVSLNEDKLVKANQNDWVLGIVSATPSIIGDNYDDEWQGKYLTDIFGDYIYEDIKAPKFEVIIDENSQCVKHETEDYTIIKRKKVNPNYDTNQMYVSRKKRKEWDCVGNGGKIIMVDDGTCQINSWCQPTNDGTGRATLSETQTKYRVIKRLDENHVKVWIW